MKQHLITIKEFQEKFPDDATCLLHLFNQEFPHPKCDKCGKVGQFSQNTNRACFSCSCGQSHIYPKAGTIFEKSSTSLHDWFYAIFLMSVSRNGVACRELQRHIGVTLKTAYRMQKQIRSMMQELPPYMSGEVEADETMVGGKRKGRRGRGAAGKTVVFGKLERGTKRVSTAIVPNVKAATLLPHFTDSVAKGTKLITDELKSYRKIARIEGMEHDTVNHGSGQYVKGSTHTNTIENFWGQLKRSLDGTHHVISPKWLHLYVSEFAFRYNHRLVPVPMFDLLLSRVSYMTTRVERQIGAYRWPV
ncbi:MAG: IS1595 family transposase [Candidatus Peribacter sp.]|nr:IS1595 family transposase [Candidatus Peribacter sp.]